METAKVLFTVERDFAGRYTMRFMDDGTVKDALVYSWKVSGGLVVYSDGPTNHLAGKDVQDAYAKYLADLIVGGDDA